MSSPPPYVRRADRFVFPSMHEGYPKALGELFTDQTRRELKAAGLDMDKLPPAIDPIINTRYMEIVARNAWPNEPKDEQLRLLGLFGIRGWQKGLLGSAVAGMLRLVGPRRTLTRLDRAFATSNNYTKATTEFVSDTEALVSVNDIDEMPTHWVGIFQGGIELLGLDGTVTIEKVALPGAVFRIKWK